MNSVLRLLSIPFVLLCAAMFLVPLFRYSVGTDREITGTVEASGLLESGGSSLRGRAVVVASVRLTDGKLVRVGIPGAVPLPVGSRVALNEVPQSFGQPRYAFLQSLPGK